MFVMLCLYSHPSHLAITGQEAVKSTEVTHNLLQRFADNLSCKGLDSAQHCGVSTSNKNKEKLDEDQNFNKDL